MQKFNFNSAANANCSAMKAETIQKNAVSPKNLRSRGNFLMFGKMKNILLILLTVAGLFTTTNSVSAQTRTKIADGVYLVSYGNNFGIEDDNAQRSWNLGVTAEKKSTGEVVYTIACKCYSRVVLQASLETGIIAILTSSGVGALGTGIVSAIAAKAYGDVCDYYAKKNGWQQ
ncbi:MAG: hypothetical protein FWD66_02255 [Paludibacter sp.]|nr:hypothetical protein [Paludibacter sp.]